MLVDFSYNDPCQSSIQCRYLGSDLPRLIATGVEHSSSQRPTATATVMGVWLSWVTWLDLM